MGDERRTLMGIAGVLAIVHVVGILWTTGARGSLIQGDSGLYFSYLPSLVLDRDLDLRNEFRVLQPEGTSEYPFGPGRAGRARNHHPIAPALLWLPGYLVGLGVEVAIGSAIDDGQPFGYGMGAALGTAVWSVFLIGLGADITRRLVRECVGAREAFPATAMAWLATPALYYTVISPMYSHGLAWLVAGLMLWATWRAAHEPDRIGLWIASGAAAGWVVAVRLQDLPLLIVPVTLLVVTLHRTTGAGRAFRLLVAWIGGVVLGYAPQGLNSLWLQGTIVPFHEVESLVAPRLSDFVDTLFSLGYRAWISWNPIILPGFIGLALLARRAETSTARWFALSGMVGALGILHIDAIHPYGAGAGFGGRRCVSALPVLAMGLAVFLSRLVSVRSRAVAWVLFPVLTVWNLWLLLSYELLIIRHGIYPTLKQTLFYAVGLGIP